MGNFAPVVGECEIGDLEVEGTIPASVRGVYLRNEKKKKWLGLSQSCSVILALGSRRRFLVSYRASQSWAVLTFVS